MTEKEKQKLRLELLEDSHFREVLGRYYATGCELLLRDSLHKNPEEQPEFVAGDFRVDIAAFQSSLFSLRNIPQHVKKILTDICFASVNEMSILRAFHLLELDDRESETEIPVSIDHVLKCLSTPANMTKIEKLRGNAKNNLDSLRAEADNLWEKHGKPARILRNDIAHGRLSILNISNEMQPYQRPQEEILTAASNLSAAVDGIYKILNRISKSCFDIQTDLPTCWDVWGSIWQQNSTALPGAWCFDFTLYPLNDRC